MLAEAASLQDQVLFVGGVVVLVLWVSLALLEIIDPALAVRWRRRYLDKRIHDSLTSRVADSFDGLTGERDVPDAWRSPKVQQRVRVQGLLNLLLGCMFGFVLSVTTR